MEIEITLDNQRIILTKEMLEILAESNSRQFKRSWLKANGYNVDETTSPDFIDGIWQTLSHIPQNAIASAKKKRIAQIEGAYKN
ncbi:hypothetical protein [Tolypothrix sp. VBCCA 56010]|uniref:hypothetical protein n=1 Tax=Tolypothrix sp. VBCCA 56010 TaxID=3137731 RepID=UPI003D7CA5F7